MPKPHNTTTCLVCGNPLVKNGRTAAGTQRWRCKHCGASSTRSRPDLQRRNQCRDFLLWLLGKLSQAEFHGGTGRTFRDHTAWCWDIEPSLGPVETRHHQILVDGIYIGSWCLLIAVTEHLQVLAWQWCSTESTAAWRALLERIPAPTVVVCDGGSGIRAALRRVWPDTQVQRCLFHVQAGIRTHLLTMNPRTPAGRRLRQLSLALSNIRTVEQAIQWQQHLDAWWQAHGRLTKERTYARNGQWWYTHDRLRKAWNLFHTLTRQGHLFTYLEHGNARTTSALEGGINKAIRTVLRNHRGMTEAHMKRAAEWFLTLHEIPLEEALQFANLPAPTLEPEPIAEEPLGPELYGKGLEAAEGLWARQGWAGRG